MCRLHGPAPCLADLAPVFACLLPGGLAPPLGLLTLLAQRADPAQDTPAQPVAPGVAERDRPAAGEPADDPAAHAEQGREKVGAAVVVVQEEPDLGPGAVWVAGDQRSLLGRGGKRQCTMQWAFLALRLAVTGVRVVVAQHSAGTDLWPLDSGEPKSVRGSWAFFLGSRSPYS